MTNSDFRSRSVLSPGFFKHVLTVAALVLCVLPVRAHATFHLMVIDELLTSYGGDANVQFVELRMLSAGQHLVGDTVLAVFDDGGYAGDVLVLPNDVAVTAAGARVLLATADFTAATGLTPDFTIPASLPLGGGMICWGAPGSVAPPPTWDRTVLANYIDCVNYGSYAGPMNIFGPTPVSLSPEGRSLQRTGNSAGGDDADFACSDPATPRRNDGATTTMAATSPCPSLPLTKDQQKCANGFINASSKVLKAYGKAAATCVKDIGNDKGAAPEPAACVAADPRATKKTGKAEANVDKQIDKHCSVPYPMDCPPPCDANDSGGATTGIDDDAELKACLLCYNKAASWSGSQPSLFKGVHGRILDGATIVSKSVDPAGAKCQTNTVKFTEKLFKTYAKEFVKCVKGEFKADALPPVDVCVGVDPKLKIDKARMKLDDKVNACTPPPAFDGGECASLDGPALTGCIDSVIRCETCQWANLLTGAAVDCDLFDNAVVDTSCQ